VRNAMGLTESEWMRAYPGNDPESASGGVLTFQEAVRENLKKSLNVRSLQTERAEQNE
jgi:hypothetical protein